MKKAADFVARHSLALGVFASPWVANPRKGRLPPLATAFGGSAFGLGGYGFFFASAEGVRYFFVIRRREWQ